MLNFTLSTSDKVSCVYQITNTITQEFYIGATKNLYYRLRLHLCHLRKNYRDHPKLQDAFNIYGENAFYSTILEKTTNLKEREEYWMNKLQPAYNKIFSLNGKVIYPQEHRDKISAGMKRAILENRASCNKKAIDVFDINGVKIDTLSCLTDFSNKYNIVMGKASSLFNGKYQQWKGLRIRLKDQFDSLLPYKLPEKGCMKATKDMCNLLPE